MIGPADEHERTMAFAEIALGQIKALRQAATPRNYEVWYAYATGYHPSLNQKINETLQQSGALSDADLDQIHETYLSPTRLTDRIEGGTATNIVPINCTMQFDVRAIPGVEVTAICTSREETARAAADRLGLPRAFWNAQEMCADPDIDIVDLGTRPSVRLPMVLAALAHGKHVYNASPHAPDWAGAKAIDAGWRAGGSIGVVDAFSQWLPAHRQMKAMLDDSYVGTPLGGTCHFNISLFNSPIKQFPYNWFAQGGQGVSAVRNNGSHALYMLRHLFGPIAELVADDSQILREWRFADGDTITPDTTVKIPIYTNTSTSVNPAPDPRCF